MSRQSGSSLTIWRFVSGVTNNNDNFALSCSELGLVTQLLFTLCPLFLKILVDMELLHNMLLMFCVQEIEYKTPERNQVTQPVQQLQRTLAMMSRRALTPKVIPRECPPLLGSMVLQLSVLQLGKNKISLIKSRKFLKPLIPCLHTPH